MKKIILTILSTFLLAAVSHSPTMAQPPTSAPASTVPPLREAALKSATYSGIFDKAIKLKGGVYIGKPFVKGDPAKPVVEFADGATRYGDLNGDGVDDAVVFLQERSGGSGVFTYIAAQLNKRGKPADAGAVRIEDRVGIKSIIIKGDLITLEVIGQGPGDAACCGSYKMTKTYALRDGKLTDVSAGQSASQKVSMDDLNDTAWTLLELKRGQPVLKGSSDVTLRFEGGQFAGMGGCNDYTGSFMLGKDNPFVLMVGDIAAATKVCTTRINAQERAYLQALNKASQWNYEYGRLALYYTDAAGKMNRLLFTPQTKEG